MNPIIWHVSSSAHIQEVNEVCIFRKEKVVVVYRTDSELRLRAMILNGKEVESDRRPKVNQKELLS